jgi:hypothetical protein
LACLQAAQRGPHNAGFVVFVRSPCAGCVSIAA